jgi:hypothetical protein
MELRSRPGELLSERRGHIMREKFVQNQFERRKIHRRYSQIDSSIVSTSVMVGRPEGVSVQHWFSRSVILGPNSSSDNSADVEPDGFIPICMSLIT